MKKNAPGGCGYEGVAWAANLKFKKMKEAASVQTLKNAFSANFTSALRCSASEANHTCKPTKRSLNQSISESVTETLTHSLK